MKTLHITIAVLLTVACAAWAKQDIVRGANIVGYKKYTLPPDNGLLLIGVNWGAVGEELRLKGVVGTHQLRAASTPDQADKVLLWNAKKEKYDAYAIYSEDHEFYACDRWLQHPVNPSIPLGSGFFIQSPDESTEPLTITISGDAVEGPPIKLNPKSKMQIIANTYPADSSVDRLVEPYRLRPGDKVAFFIGSGYDTYKLDNGGRWKHVQTQKAAPPVETGEAIWLLPAERSVKKR